MKQIFLILISSLCFAFPLKIFAKENGILYLWEISERKEWKKFGDENIHQKYNGEIKYGKPHGLGIKIFLDGKKYMGEWKKGKRHGQGTIINPDGIKFEGKWKFDKPWNIKKIDLRGRVYDEYINGVKQNNNIKNGILFFRNEKGTFGWNEVGNEKKDYKYIGDIQKGKPNGWGKFIYPSGYIYEGQFRDGKAHGTGHFYFPDGKKGVGHFKENKPWNITEYDNESKIIGEYVDGVFQIKKKITGILFTRKIKDNWVWFDNTTYPYNGKYHGEIKNGKPDGKGSLILLNGSKYIGEFKDGNWDGQGIFYFPKGNKWKGEFKDDSPWNVNWYNKSGQIKAIWKKGIKQNILPKN